MRHAVCTLLAVILLAGSAAAQPSVPPPAKPASIGFRAYGTIDFNFLTAVNSFDAVFGDHQLTSYGGGAEINVWKTLFLRISAAHVRRTGTRVFVDGSDVFPLDIPLTVTMTPIEAGGGWRFASSGRVTPYVGGAFLSVGYQETSDFATSADNVNERYTGVSGFGGADVVIWKGVFVGGEVQFRHVSVPDVSTSVMHAFGETDLGGVTARVLIGFSTK
jgi:hypothetical protein